MFSTFAEQDYFEYPQPGTYSGVVINANMAAHAPAGLGAFLLEKTAPETKYLIDPLTHAFQHDPSRISNSGGSPKSSIQRLAEAYGAPIEKLVGNRPLLPEDFQDEGLLIEFVKKCLEFQRSQLSSEMQNSDASKYMEDADGEVHPHALVAPYFYVAESTFDEWLPINIRAAQIAVEQKEERERIFAEVAISQGVLVTSQIQAALIEQYADIGIDGVLLWVDNLDEQHASRFELECLIQLSRGLRNNQLREVINLHGSYFSILSAGVLGQAAMSGVTHAPEFGEYRSVVPVGGGIPISRFYVPDLHVRVRYRDALAMFNGKNWLRSADEFHGNVCNCQECQNTIEGDAANFTRYGEGTVKTIKRGKGIVRLEFPTTESKQRCLRHYLQRKRREYIAAAEAPADALIANLLDGENKFKDVIGLDGVAHLKLWREVLASFSG